MTWFSFSSWRHWLVFETWGYLHLLNKRCSFRLLLLFGLIISQHNFTEPDSFNEIFRDIADFFPFQSVIQEEWVWLLFLKIINLIDLRVDYFVEVISNFLKVGLSFMDVNGLDFLLENSIHWLFPLINAFDTMNSENPQVRYFLFKGFTYFSRC